MTTKKLLRCMPALVCLGAAAQTPEAVSEKDYLADVPVVLSVSRLPQRLDELPGAVTIIDREMIRMSGARDVADLLRFVPGFRVSSSFESNTPQGSYHLSLSDYANHMQVMVDGRSVYSTYLRGSTGPGLQTVALEDIERIEVYRGSNSAAYGARAYLGTINIVTRDPADTQGGVVQAAGGDNGIQDGLVRLGWGSEDAQFRLTADGRSDSGLRGTSGGDRVQRFNLRADVRAGGGDTAEFRAGQTLVDAGVGFSGQDGNAPRTRRIDTSYLQFDWRRSLNADEDIAFQASHTVEVLRDQFPYAPAPSLTIDFGGQASNDNLSVQHTVRMSPTVRTVWGGELRRETITSYPLYDTGATFVTDFARLFANAEWRMHPSLLLNAGALYERSSIAGEQVAPRFMLNWRLAEGHTLRYGLTQAFRPPSTYEKYSNVRYYLNGVLADSTDVARGNVSSEKVQTREVGYLAELPVQGFSLDVRVFEESVTDYIKSTSYSLPGSGNDNQANDFVNGESFKIRGYEYQIRMRPWQDARLVYVQSILDSTQSTGDNLIHTYGSQGLMLMQTLPAGYSASVMYSESDASWFPAADSAQPAVRRTDLRLAKALRLGGQRAELSFVVQNLGGPYQDFMPTLRFYQQAYVMLRVEN